MMTTSHRTRFFMANWTYWLLMCLLFVTQTAHADFRKALDAYIARDGATMLKEVKDAVGKKSDDGLILFLSVLERDSIFSQNFSFLFEEENRDKVEVRKLSPNSMGKYVKDNIPWLELIPENGRSEFLILLQQAAEKSSLESQFRLISLRSPYGLYDKFDYDEMAKIKLESTEKKKSNVYSTHFPMLANKGYNELLHFLSDFAPKGEKPQWQQKLLNANSTRSLLLQAANQLTTSTSKKSEDKALRLMKAALARPDADYFYSEVATPMSAYYLKKGDKKSLKQAYLWALVELVLGEPSPNRNDNKPIKSLSELKRIGGFQRLGLLELDTIWSKNSPSQNWDYRTLPNEFKEFKKLEIPELIAKNKTVDLKVQPILSFHHFNYDNQIVPLGVSAKNFLIDVYADGRVNFSIGPRFDRTQNKDTLIILSPQVLKQLLAEFDNLDFENEPLNTMSKKSCGMGGCGEFYDAYNHLMGLSSNYYITRRVGADQRTIIYYLLEGVEDLPVLPAKVFSLLETQLHTQQYRCGTVKERAYYKYCIDFDSKIFETASHEDVK